MAEGISYLHGIDMVRKCLAHSAEVRLNNRQIPGAWRSQSSMLSCLSVSRVLDYLFCPQCNVLVSQDGTAKLSDFDHSILLSNCHTLVFSATTNPGGGTPRWMVSLTTGSSALLDFRIQAPELLLSSEDDTGPPGTRSKEADIYALGMVCTPPYPYIYSYLCDFCRRCWYETSVL